MQAVDLPGWLGSAVFIVSTVLILLTALTGHVLHRIKQRRMERHAGRTS
ncbi:hypothetical protein [Xanthomonas arboricola]|nr:hypothetical protein [Xanthomonas arboricola]